MLLYVCPMVGMAIISEYFLELTMVFRNISGVTLIFFRSSSFVSHFYRENGVDVAKKRGNVLVSKN